MAQGLLRYAQDDPARVMVSDADRSFSRAEFNHRVNQFVHLLRQDGIDETATVAILAGNSADYVTALIAAGVAGVAHVPINWHLGEDEIAYILRSSGCVALIADDTHELTARQATAQAGINTVILLGDQLDQRLNSLPATEPDHASLATAVFYTSGTTGRPKGTRMAQLDEALTAEAQADQFRRRGFDQGDVHLVVGPLYHGGPILQAITAVMTGAQLRIMARFDAEEVLRLIATHRVTNTLLVPTHCVRLLRLPESARSRYDVSSLREVFHIGAMMPTDVKQQMIEWWGPILIDAYGCSELGMVTLITSPEWLERPGSVGRALPSFTLQIVGPDNEELGPGEVGTIYITAHNDTDLVYLDDPDATAGAHRGLRQFTVNDLGWLDDDGYLYLADRRVDLIISGGVNIYPADVEGVLIMHPAVDDVGVFGIPDQEWGHAVKAAVQLRPGWAPTPETEATILDWARTRMAHLKVPCSIDFHDQLPRFTNGKLHRRALRDPYWTTAGSV